MFEENQQNDCVACIRREEKKAVEGGVVFEIVNVIWPLQSGTFFLSC
jgi:hypothetical protein